MAAASVSAAMHPAAAPADAPRVKRVRRALPAVLMRAGTSKGLFLHRSNLPASEEDWEMPLLAAMGSRYNDPRQIDGVGGATSVTSKVAVLEPSKREGIDVDYTFVQVAVGKEKIDLSGNCGNMCAGVGPFAVQERMVTPAPGARTVDVSIFNTNTCKKIVETVSINEEGDFEEDGDCMIPGVKGPGSEIKVAFVDPAGSMTGKLFPTGKRCESITVEGGVADLPTFSVDVTIIDAANPFILVDSETLPQAVRSQEPESELYMQVSEAIRQRGAVRMGLADSLEAASLVRGTPKLAYISKPAAAAATPEETPDIFVLAFSMGKPHPSLQLTGGACMASATVMEGTVAWRIAQGKPRPSEDALTPERTPSPKIEGDVENMETDAKTEMFKDGMEKQMIRIQHSRGTMDVEAWTKLGEDGGREVERCIGIRTARRIFEGKVYYYQ